MTTIPTFRRILIALTIGTAASFVASIIMRATNSGMDFTWTWQGVNRLLAGVNPYHAPGFMNLPLFYPLPALLATVPFGLLPAWLAGSLFSGLSAGVLVFALTKDGYTRLPIVLSAPFLTAIVWGQWSLIITAAALLPVLYPLALCKPNIGLAVLVTRATRHGLIVCAGVLALSLILLPTWLTDWRNNIGSHDNFIPLFTVPGLLLVIAGIRWRDQNAQLLLCLAIVPQRFYDPLALWLLPRSLRQSMILSMLSWIGFMPWIIIGPFVPLAAPPAPWIVLWLYLPALVCVFWNPEWGRWSAPMMLWLRESIHYARGRPRFDWRWRKEW